MCNKCMGVFPPNFVEPIKAKEYLCVFCQKGVDQIRYGEENEKVATRKEIIKEYDIYLKMVKERNDILKKTMKGEVDVPANLIDFTKG